MYVYIYIYSRCAQLAEMPSCSLPKSLKRSWLQQGVSSQHDGLAGVKIDGSAVLESHCETGKVLAGKLASQSTKDFKMVAVDTVNGTTAKSGHDYMVSDLCTAEAVCMQELAAQGDSARSLEKDFAIAGWIAKFNDSEVTKGQAGGEGQSAGTGVAIRKGWGCCAVPGALDGTVVDHRCSLLHWNALVKGGVDLGSVYLISGAGPSSQDNLDILEDVGERLACLNRPFVIGGDWNMTADELETTGWVQRVGGAIVKPQAALPTSCASGRTIDFFVISQSLLYMVMDCYVVQEAKTTPHRPVRVVFASRMQAPLMRVVAGPKPFPVHPVVGPRRPQGHWDDVVALAEDRGKPAQERIGPLYCKWVLAYEATMCGLHDIGDTMAAGYCGRAEPARGKWVSPQGSKGDIHPKTCRQAKTWRWMADRVKELVVLQGKAAEGASDHRRKLIIRLRKWRPPDELEDLAHDHHETKDGRGSLIDDAKAAASGFRRWVKRASACSIDGADWWITQRMYIFIHTFC